MGEEKKPVKVALYLRVSSKPKEGATEREKRQTNDNQELRLDEWLSSQKNIHSYEKFADEQTGRNDKRPSFQEMMKGVGEGKFDLIVALRVDRLFRSMKDLTSYAWFLKEHKTGMQIIDQGVNIDPEWRNPTAQLLLNILGAVAEFEDVLISARTIDGLERVKDEGRRIGKPPLGFVKNPDPEKTGEFVTIPGEIYLAKRVIKLWYNKASLGEISQKTGLNISHVRSIIRRRDLYNSIP